MAAPVPVSPRACPFVFGRGETACRHGQRPAGPGRVVRVLRMIVLLGAEKVGRIVFVDIASYTPSGPGTAALSRTRYVPSLLQRLSGGVATEPVQPVVVG